MNQRSVGNRIAVDFGALNVPIQITEALGILKTRNIRPIEVSVEVLARSLVGKASWKLPSRLWEAPYYFDCASLTKWLYGQKGVWIPRRPLGQLEFCRQFGSIQSVDEITTGDLLFVSSPYRDGIKSNSEVEVGHVCIVSDLNNAICATNSEFGTGIVELPIARILSSRRLAAIGRVICPDTLTTLIFPPEREIETVDDIKHIILRSLQGN